MRKKTKKKRLDPKLPLGHAILGGRRKKRWSRRKRGGVDFHEGDKVKFSPKMREDLTGIRSENALNWMETWTGTVESVNDAKPKKAVQVYWKTGGGGEAWTSNPKEHLINLSGSQTGSGRKRKTRRKRRRSRKKRGGNYSGFSVGDKVALSDAGLARVAAGRPYPGWSDYRTGIPARHRNNAANWIGIVSAAGGSPWSATEILRGADIRLRGMVSVSWISPPIGGLERLTFRARYKDFAVPVPAHGYVGHAALSLRGGPVGDIRLLPDSVQPGGWRRKTRRKRRRSRRKRRRTRRKKRRKRRKSRCRKKCKKHSRVHFFHAVGEAEAFEGKESCQHGGGDPQKDLHDAIKENHEVGAIQAIHNGAKVNQARDYTRPKPLETDSPEGRICTGETVMRKGKQTPLTHAIQENAMIGIAEHILGNRVGQEPGIDLDFKDPWYEPPKTAYEIAKDLNNTAAMERINDRRAADAGFGSGGGEKMDVDSETEKKNKYKF